MIRPLLLLLMLLPGPALAFTLNELQSRLSRAERLEGRFEQQRYLADLDARLTSRGRFLYERDRRVVWVLEAPVQDRIEFTPGSASDLATAFGDSQRSRSQVAALFLNLLEGDWQALEERFTVELMGSADDWQVTLTPKRDALREHIERIHLHGGRYLEGLTMHAANQDVLDVRFFDQRLLDTPASATEDSADGMS